MVCIDRHPEHRVKKNRFSLHRSQSLIFFSVFLLMLDAFNIHIWCTKTSTAMPFAAWSIPSKTFASTHGPHARNLDFIILFWIKCALISQCMCLLSVLVSIQPREEKSIFNHIHSYHINIYVSLCVTTAIFTTTTCSTEQRRTKKSLLLINKWQRRRTNGITAISPRDLKRK